MTQRPNFAKSSVDTENSNGEITFIAARNVRNLNGFEYSTETLLAQDATGEYSTLGTDWQDVAIPLMEDHGSSIGEKIGNIYTARLVTNGDEQSVEMKAKFFKGDLAQEVRQRILDGELTDVSITTDWGSGYTDEDEFDVLKNAHIIEVSVVYAGAEPKAKILASNSVNTDDDEEETETPETNELEEAQARIAELEAENEALKASAEDETEEEVESKDEAEAEEESDEEETNNSEEEEEMAKQPIQNQTTELVADKAMVLNALVDLAKSGAIKNLNRSQVIAAVKNAITLKDGSSDYVVPDAVFTEILAATRDTDILSTFKNVPAKKLTLMAEKRSEADLARAGKWSKGDLKAIQTMQLDAQKLETDFIFKMQEISYADLQEDFGNILYSFIRTELPQKVDEEEERAFIVGDGRANGSRKITSIVSLDAAAADSANGHVYNYDGSGDASAVAALLNGSAKLGEDGTTYAVMNKSTLSALRAQGLSTASGLPFSEETVAGAIGVERIFTREYVAANVVYIYTGDYVYRLTGGNAGDTIEQYDIDYNNRKIEFIRPAGGAATGVYSAVKVTLPTVVSA